MSYPHFPDPHYYRYARGLGCRGPSRILWFVLGGAAAAWWLRHKEARCSGPYRRRALEGKAPSPDDSAVWDAPSPRRAYADRFEAERQRIRHVGRQASDTVADISETALDSLLANIQTLRTKLVASRTEREKMYQEHLEREKEPGRDV